jgi:NAD(P)-dependent dehydrogenase (short-subunit alcohol dehydrogenase family)
MQKPEYRSALIVGTGPGLSASLARLFAKQGLAVSLAARQTDKLAALTKETGAEAHACNAADPTEVAGLFAALDAKGRTPDVVVYNASNRVRGPLIDLAPDFAGALTPGGKIILAGLLNTQADTVAATYEKLGFALADHGSGEWPVLLCENPRSDGEGVSIQ